MRKGGLKSVAVHLVRCVYVGVNYNALVKQHGVDNLHNVLIAADSNHCVNLGKFLVHLLLVALCKTARDDNLLVDAVVFAVDCLHDFFNSLFLCALNKSAGVDYNHVRKTRLVYQLIARLFDFRKHKLRVALIFRTSQRHHSYLHCIFSHQSSSCSSASASSRAMRIAAFISSKPYPRLAMAAMTFCISLRS